MPGHNPGRGAVRPNVSLLHSDLDSNQERQSQSLLCCRYTIRVNATFPGKGRGADPINLT